MSARYSVAYGLDASGPVWVLARASRRGAVRTALRAVPESAEMRRAIEAVRAEVEGGGTALAVAAPAVVTVVRRLKAPFADVRKASKVWPALFDVELPFPVEGAICQFGRPRVAEGAAATVAVALRKSDAAAFEEECRARGFSATHCDAEAPALWEQLTAELPPARSGQARMLVWLAGDHATLARGKGAEFAAAHVVRVAPAGGGEDASGAFDAAWAARIGPIAAVHAAETEAAEMDVWWAGPGAEDEGRRERLRRLLPTAVAMRHETVRDPAGLLARALARRAADGGGANFKEGEFAHPARVAREARMLRAAYARVAAASLLVLGLHWGNAAAERRRDAALQAELAAAALSIVGESVPRGQEALMVERALARRDEATRPFRTALAEEGVEVLLVRTLEQAESLGLEIARFSATSRTLGMEGTASNVSDVERLADRLRERGWSVQTESPGGADGGRIRYVLKGTALHEG